MLFFSSQGEERVCVLSHSSPGWVHAKPLQLCLTLCNLTEDSPPGFSVHGIFQARIVEWVAIAFSASTRYVMAFMSTPEKHCSPSLHEPSRGHQKSEAWGTMGFMCVLDTSPHLLVF